MAKQISLRDFQQALAQRLREAQTEAAPTSRLGVQAGGGNWLLKLDDAGEVLPLPEISSVPLTKSWYLGLANIRGVLESVVDFGAFMGGEPTARVPDCRLLLIADRFQSFSGLLISRMLGLRNVQSLETAESAPNRPWVGATYRDREGHAWHELDVGALVAHDEFLSVGVLPVVTIK
jgi:twitching motility protein PilI